LDPFPIVLVSRIGCKDLSTTGGGAVLYLPSASA